MKCASQDASRPSAVDDQSNSSRRRPHSVRCMRSTNVAGTPAKSSPGRCDRVGSLGDRGTGLSAIALLATLDWARELSKAKEGRGEGPVMRRQIRARSRGVLGGPASGTKMIWAMMSASERCAFAEPAEDGGPRETLRYRLRSPSW